MTRDEIKEIFGEVLFDVSIELGRKKVSVGEMLRYEAGTIIRLAKTSGESVDLLVNLKPLAYGEIMVLDERLAIRITEILSKEMVTDKFKEGLYG